MRAKSLWSCLTLCNPMDCSPLGSSVHGILQVRILEQVAVSFSRGSSRPRDQTHISCIGRQVLYHLSHLNWKEIQERGDICMHACSITQSCPTLCNTMDCSLLGSSIHGIFQARILEWIAISFSRGSAQPRDQTQVSHIAGRLFTV